MSALRAVAPTVGASPKRGRRLLVVAGLLASHCAVFALGFQWSSAYGGWQTRLRSGVPDTSSQPGATLPTVPTAVVGETERSAHEATALHSRATHAHNTTALLAHAAKAEALLARVHAASAAVVPASPPPAPVVGSPPLPPPAPAPARLQTGAVLDLGTGGSSAWLTQLPSVVVNQTVIYTWTNFHMRDFLLNFLIHLQEHGLTSFVIGAMDPDTLKYLKEVAPTLQLTVPVLQLNAGLSTGDYGWNSPAFKRMAKYKFQAVQQMQSLGYDVIVADTDTVWIRNPLPLFASIPLPDILTSTDVLRRMPVREQLHSTLNIGVMLFRARPGAIAFVTAFYEEMVSDPKFGSGDAEWDQARFNRMVREGMTNEPSGDLALGWSGRIKVQALDIVDFPNGHVYFAQRLPQTLGRVPYIVHATFQYGGTAGKRHRFREWQLFKADPAEYYAPKGGLLSYEFTPDPKLLAVANSSVDAHFALMNPQLSALRSAWGVARALGRKLIMPRFVCGMDRVWFPHDGVFPGSDPAFTIPFTPCPMDHVLDTEGMEKRGLLDEIREWSLLDNARMPKATLDGAAWAEWLPADSKDQALVGADGAYRVPMGAKADAVRALFAGAHNTPLLRFRSMPGTGALSAFGGFKEPREQADWHETLRQSAAFWCCINEQQAKQRGEQFPPGQTWYDLLWDVVPHTDRHGRSWNDAWSIKLGP